MENIIKLAYSKDLKKITITNLILRRREGKKKTKNDIIEVVEFEDKE